MLERENVSRKYKRIPDARYKLFVDKVVKNDDRANSRTWSFSLHTPANGVEGIEVRTAAWERKELLLALGGTIAVDDPDSIEIDYDTIPGKGIEADVKSEEFKGKDKNGNPTPKQKYVLSNITASEEIPF